MVLLLGVTGCASRVAPATPYDLSNASLPGVDASDAQRLQALWQSRSQDISHADFSLGPGDVLEISAPLEEFDKREVRVSPQDTIDLPMLGELSVKGLSEQDLTGVLKDRLSAYMHDPPVSVFVKEYGSRQVSIVGAVQKPGLYPVMSGSDSLMEMISKAGGMTQDAAARVIFIPAGAGGPGLELASSARAANTGSGSNLDGLASPAASDDHDGAAAVDSASRLADSDGSSRGETHYLSAFPAARVDAIRPAAAVTPHSSASSTLTPALVRAHPIIFDMTEPSAASNLELPARPGDVLVIPTAGEVTVGGWVQSPGAYKITPGMTALSAISAAGGALFTNSAQVLRTAPNGDRTSIAVNLRQVQHGQKPDLPIQAGDVVMADRSAIGAVPYALYEIFTKFGTGMYLPMP